MRKLCVALAIVLAPVAARAECLEIRDFVRQETTGDGKYVDTFSFRRDHRADSVLMLVKTTVEKGHLPSKWLFLHRSDPTSSQYCVVSRGVTFGQHQDMAENDSANDFGPPGSGFPQCATSNTDFTAAEQLRFWANRELGSGSILYTASPDGPGFQFVIADSQDWIVIEDDADKSCLFDRGTDIQLRFNTTLLH